MTLGDNIKEVRAHIGMTQGQLATLSGVSKTMLSQIESGAVKAPSVHTVWRITEALGIPIERLMRDVMPYHEPRTKHTFLLTEAETHRVTEFIERMKYEEIRIMEQEEIARIKSLATTGALIDFLNRKGTNE